VGLSDTNNCAPVWIFTRSSNTWSQEGDTLIATGYIGAPYLGTSISLSSDGNTLAFGGNGDNGNIGATWIFTRSSNTWSQQGDKLIGTGYVGTPSQGSKITLSSDGNILAIAGDSDNTDIGAVWIFTRSLNTWSQQGNKLVGTYFIGTPNQGWSVALSSDGSTLAIGGPNDDYEYEASHPYGATWVFFDASTSSPSSPPSSPPTSASIRATGSRNNGACFPNLTQPECDAVWTCTTIIPGLIILITCYRIRTRKSISD
jgi:hypothetical protein